VLGADDVPDLGRASASQRTKRSAQTSRLSSPRAHRQSANEVWSWDITKLMGPAKWTYFYLYVILDIFSRYGVGWMLAYRESGELAKKLIEQTLERHNIFAGTLTVHADRGAPMTSKAVAFFLAELGVTKTHSRPYVSNDNPYSESQFKTMKYRPNFRIALVVIKMRTDSAPSFSLGTTTSIITAAWDI
jgi:putative transposase